MLPQDQPAIAPATVQPIINVAPPTTNVVIVNQQSGPNILVRLIWFVILGMWLGSIATFVGYALCLIVIGLPIGLMILNNLPKIMTLRPSSRNISVATMGNTTVVTLGTAQRNFLLRVVYFFLVGWWLSFFWIALAWLLAMFWWLPPGLCMLGAFWLFDRIPAVMTLRRN